MVSDEQTPPVRQRRWRLLVLTLLLLLAGLAWLGWWKLSGQFWEHTENAQVSGNRVAVMPQITGTVVAVRADDTDRVRRGDLLVQLDDADAQVAVQAAQADLADAAREVMQLAAERDRAQAAIAVAMNDRARAAADLERRRGLILKRSISAEELQHAELSATAAQSSLKVAQQQMVVAQAALGAWPLRKHPRVQRAAANLTDALLGLERCRILAPVDGQVAQRSVQLGQQVTPSSRLLDLVPLDDRWVEVNFKENQLASLRLDQPVRMSTDVYGDRLQFDGRVAGIGAGTGSVFSLLPPQNATGNWIKIVQRVPVRVAIDMATLQGWPLPLGASVRVTVDTHDRGGAPLTGNELPAAGLYSTDIYAARLADIQARVRRLSEASFSAADQAH